MRMRSRKTTPKVKKGKVQRKNRSVLTPNYYDTPMPHLVIDRKRPGRGYRHLIPKRDLRTFIELLPEWDELSEGLNAVVLAPGERDTLGWHETGVVGICAWERSIAWEAATPTFHRKHEELLDKLGIPCWPDGEEWHIEFDLLTAKAFQLIHVFVHELGHHHDRITTRSQKHAARGEPYADAYAQRHEDLIIDRYRSAFEI